MCPSLIGIVQFQCFTCMSFHLALVSIHHAPCECTQHHVNTSCEYTLWMHPASCVLHQTNASCVVNASSIMQMYHVSCECILCSVNICESVYCNCILDIAHTSLIRPQSEACPTYSCHWGSKWSPTNNVKGRPRPWRQRWISVKMRIFPIGLGLSGQSGKCWMSGFNYPCCDYIITHT